MKTKFKIYTALEEKRIRLVATGEVYPEGHAKIDWIRDEGHCYILVPNLNHALLLRPHFKTLALE